MPLSEWEESQRIAQAERVRRAQESRRKIGEGGRVGARVIQSLRDNQFKAPDITLWRAIQLHLFAQEFGEEEGKEEEMPALPDKIKEHVDALNEQGFTRKRIAEHIEVSAPALNNAMRGAPLKEEKIAKLAKLKAEDLGEPKRAKASPKKSAPPKATPQRKVKAVDPALLRLRRTISQREDELVQLRELETRWAEEDKR